MEKVKIDDLFETINSLELDDIHEAMERGDLERSFELFQKARESAELEFKD